ncbi:MAG: hypothetical protein GX900_08265 [Clostridiaceae bacterium]|nr:hypothetical protein [Clostridiaceae bacterium]
MNKKLVLEACGKALPEQIIDNDWFAAQLDTSDGWIRQRVVFRYATSTLPRVLQELAEAGKLETDAINFFLFHRANSRIIDSIAARLDLPAERFPQNLAFCGNTSAASLPLLLADFWSDGTLSRAGQQNLNICLVAFGAGMSYGSVLMCRNS